MPNQTSNVANTNHEKPVSPEERFTLAPLPYAYDALEPVIDRETMHWHHDVHHKGYVDKLNKALADDKRRDLALEQMFAKISSFPDAVRNNAGGHWNHTFFWNIMTDRKEDQEVSPGLVHALERSSFTSLDDFKQQFVRAGTDHFGSGWVWLIKNGERLQITTTSGHDNPLMDVVEERGEPLLVCDLWEHAYYLKFKANREDFLRRFFAVVNWTKVCRMFDH